MILSRGILAGILLVLLVAAAVGGFNYWKRYEEEKLDRLAALVYDYERGKVKGEDIEERLKDSPLYPYFLALTSKDPDAVFVYLKDEDIAPLFREKRTYLLYRKGKPAQALKEIGSVKKGDFNYPSSLLLKGIIHEALGEKEEAAKTYREIIEGYGGTYFGRMAEALLLSSR